MIRVLEEHIDEDSITFDINGKEVKLSFEDGREIEKRLFDLHFTKFVNDRKRSKRGQNV